ncbi:MAG: hypothetical protein H7Y60_09880 [Rhodospirillaceae bacterium]|nr:hypothetical protein [Rhodospirillales bacterium]
MTALTTKEQRAIELTAQLWNVLVELGGHHPADMAETARDIHNIQNRVMARVACRAHPDLFTMQATP